MNIRAIFPAGAAVFSFLFAGQAAAHTFGAHGAGFAEGFIHPFLGLDHLLAMLAVGIWAAQLGGRALWLVPLAFLSVMVGGAALAHSGLPFAPIEAMIAASVLVLGLLVAGSVRVSAAVGAMAVAFFAYFHGYAHGLEIPQAATPVAYVAGFMLATGCLHLLGIGLGSSLKRAPLLTRLSGSALAATGVYLLAGL